MLKIRAKTVYVDPSVKSLPQCQARFERMLPHIEYDEIGEYDEEARRYVAEIGARRHGKDNFGDDAVLVFTTFDESRSTWYYHWRDEAGKHGGACQPALELNIVDGCVFRCAYCGFGRSVIFYLDVERFMKRLDDVFAKYRDQRLYKYSNVTDLPAFEPELDAVVPMIERFSKEPDRYLMLFTKSDNMDFLENLDHQGHTIISWSLTSETSSRLVDKDTPTMQARIKAMRKMQDLGYLVRARLSPIIPVRNWEEEYEELFELLFQEVEPDLVTLELLGWMDIGDLLAIMDRGRLDEDLIREAEAAAEGMKEVFWGPFTQRAHEEVYRYCIEKVQSLSPKTPVSVCHGTPATWNALGELMKMTPESYICNCGPLSAPGGEVYKRNQWNALSRQPSLDCSTL